MLTHAGILIAHVPCASCRYDLFGRELDGKCSECGADVAKSIRPSRLVFAPRISVRLLQIFLAVQIIEVMYFALLTTAMNLFGMSFLGWPYFYYAWMLGWCFPYLAVATAPGAAVARAAGVCLAVLTVVWATAEIFTTLSNLTTNLAAGLVVVGACVATGALLRRSGSHRLGIAFWILGAWWATSAALTLLGLAVMSSTLAGQLMTIVVEGPFLITAIISVWGLFPVCRVLRDQRRLQNQVGQSPI